MKPEDGVFGQTASVLRGSRSAFVCKAPQVIVVLLRPQVGLSGSFGKRTDFSVAGGR